MAQDSGKKAYPGIRIAINESPDALVVTAVPICAWLLNYTRPISD